MGMDKRERMRDVRADRNLDDVARSPAPWDAEAMKQLRKANSNNNGADGAATAEGT